MRNVLVVVLLTACSDNGFTQLTQEDFFQQNRRNTVDLLLVVDNSCSMVEEQDKLASNFDSFIQYFDEAEVDWQIAVITTDTNSEQFSGRMIGGDDELILADPKGTPVDTVEYDWDWPVAPGVVMALDSTWYNGISNDNQDNWCPVTGGSPGELNSSCRGGGAGMEDRYGAVLITEFLADPDGVADSAGEWVEITNVSDADQDLSGWSLRDAGRNAYAFPAGTVLPIGASLVLARSTDSATNGGVAADLALGADFTLNNHELILTDETEEPAELFAEMVAQGITGSGIEMGFEAAYLALTEPLLSGENAGFLREEANLSILVVSDEEDSSPQSVNDYLNYFTGLKGEEAYRNHARMNVSGVVGMDVPDFEGEPSCRSSNGVADYGSRYVYAVNRTGGLAESICEEDFSPLVERLGLTLSGLEVEFALSRVPVLETLRVSIYDGIEESTKVRDLTLDVDYTYVEETNTIRFENDQIPESEQYILAEYRIQSGG